MKTIATMLAAAAFAVAGSAASASDLPKGEERLAKLIEGRVAGEPQRCISTTGRESRLQVIDRVGVVFDAGKTIWVARASNPSSIRDRDVLVIERFGSQLCREDVKYTVDRFDGGFRSVTFLEDFVPYTRQG